MKENDVVSSSNQEKPGSLELSHALLYLSHGLSVIPVGMDQEKKGWKKPYIDWKPYQTKLPTESEVRNWWGRWPDARVGIVTGTISGLVAVDIDPHKGGSTNGVDLPITLVSNTGGGGWHYIYKHPKKRLIPNTTNWPIHGVDIRGDGGFIVAPPSVHLSGKRYEWEIDFDPILIAPCPKWLMEHGSNKPHAIELLNGVSEGGRNDAASRVIGLILSELPKGDWLSHGWKQTLDWNNNNHPPLTETELKNVFQSIASREERQRADENATDENRIQQSNTWKGRVARALMEDSNMSLYHDEAGRAYAKYKRDDHWELWPCGSEEFRLWISYYCFQKRRTPASSNDINDITTIISAKAKFEGTQIQPNLRTGQGTDECFYYDLASKNWDSVKISSQGWKIEQDSPVFFRRFSHTSEQMVPDTRGDLCKMLEFINLKGDENQLLYLCYLVSSFIPDIQHPILLLSGGKGSAKSTFTDLTKAIVDPSALNRLSFPKKYDELAMVLSQNWMVSFDNVSQIDDWLSDALCKACTGEAFSKRRLYTDEDPIIVSYKRSVLINGLNVPAEKADLLDRILLFATEPIPKNQRKSERELIAAFKQALPSILGGIFDTLSKAMKHRKDVPTHNLCRLADFDLWGRAIAIALGYTAEDFIRALEVNISRQNEEAVRQSVVATAIVEFMEKQFAPWEGTASLLLERLGLVAMGMKIDTGEKTWPKTPAMLSRRLNEVAGNLLEEQIKISFTHDGKKRNIRLEKLQQDVVNDVSSVIQN